METPVPRGMEQVIEWRCGFDDCGGNHHILFPNECVCVRTHVRRLPEFRVQFYGARL